MTDSPLQKLSKKIAAKKKLTVSLKKKRPARPKPKTEAELRLELTELMKLVRAEVVASNRATKQAVLFLDKMAVLEEATQNLEKLMRANGPKRSHHKKTHHSSSSSNGHKNK